MQKCVSRCFCFHFIFLSFFYLTSRWRYTTILSIYIIQCVQSLNKTEINFVCMLLPLKTIILKDVLFCHNTLCAELTLLRGCVFCAFLPWSHYLIFFCGLALVWFTNQSPEGDVRSTQANINTCVIASDPRGWSIWPFSTWIWTCLFSFLVIATVLPK